MSALDDDARAALLERIASGEGCDEQSEMFAESECIAMALADAAELAGAQGFELVIVGRDNGACGSITADLRRDRIVATVIGGVIHSVSFT